MDPKLELTIQTRSLKAQIYSQNLLIPMIHGVQIPVPGNLVRMSNYTRVQNELETSDSESKEDTEVKTDAEGQVERKHSVSQALVEEGGSPVKQLIVSGPVLRKTSTSAYADALYGKADAPPPIQHAEEEISETHFAGGFQRSREIPYEPRDFTYMDKLRRAGTRTEIRRWSTYAPVGEEETAFFGRPADVEVPAEAYAQGSYFEQLNVEALTKEFKLPTIAYVAAPKWIRRMPRCCNSKLRCF